MIFSTKAQRRGFMAMAPILWFLGVAEAKADLINDQGIATQPDVTVEGIAYCVDWLDTVAPIHHNFEQGASLAQQLQVVFETDESLAAKNKWAHIITFVYDNMASYPLIEIENAVFHLCLNGYAQSEALQ